MPVRLLDGFAGYLQTDGYQGYALVCYRQVVASASVTEPGKVEKATFRKLKFGSTQGRCSVLCGDVVGRLITSALHFCTQLHTVAHSCTHQDIHYTFLIYSK